MPTKPSRAPFIGRAAQLQRVRVRLDELSLGLGAVVVVAGASGVGKTRFLEECDGLAASLNVDRRTYRLARRSVVADRRSTIALDASRGAVFIDDAHRASADNAASIERLLERARDEPLLVVACVDHAFVSPDNAAEIFEQSWIARAAETVVLPPLAPDESELLVRCIVHGRGLSRALLREVVDLADGNARYAVEMGNAIESGARAGALVPQSARHALRVARSTLDAETFEILRLCAVIGEPIDADWIVRVARRPARTIAAALQRACDAELLVEDPACDGVFRFRDRAIAKAAYVSMVSVKRAALHRDVVRRLRAEPGNLALAGPLARQHEALGEFERAREWLLPVAHDTMGRGDLSTAADLFSRALAFAQTGTELWIDVMRDLLWCRWQLSQHGEIVLLGESLLSCIDTERHAPLVLRTLWMLFYSHLNDDDRESARRIADMLPPTNPSGVIARDVAWLVLVCAYCGAGQRPAAEELMRRIDPAMLVDATGAWRYAYARVVYDAPFGSTQALEAAVCEADRLASEVDVQAVHNSYLAGVGSALHTGDVFAAMRYCVKASALVERESGERRTHLEREAAKFHALTLSIAGDLHGAHQRLLSNVSWKTPGRYNEAMHSALAVTIGMHVADIGLIEAFFDPDLLWNVVASREGELCGLLLRGYADLMETRGMSDDLHRCLRECLRERIVDPYGYIGVAAARHVPETELADVTDYIQSYRRDAREPIAPAHESLARAIVAHRRGRKTDAVRAAREAARLYGSMGWHLSEALARRFAGESAVAAEIYARCGAHADVARLSAARTRKARYASFGARLTQRERHVASLLSREQSDRQIAAALAISVRTVHHHVEAILSKLGVTDRTGVSRALSALNVR